MNGPAPDIEHPMQGLPQPGFLKNFIKSENIIVDNYRYYDPLGTARFESNVLYHFPVIVDCDLAALQKAAGNREHGPPGKLPGGINRSAS